jgi:hypothetical protein
MMERGKNSLMAGGKEVVGHVSLRMSNLSEKMGVDLQSKRM